MGMLERALSFLEVGLEHELQAEISEGQSSDHHQAGPGRIQLRRFLHRFSSLRNTDLNLVEGVTEINLVILTVTFVA